MIQIAIGLLWVAIGVIILGIVIFILLNAIERFFPGAVSANVAYAIWSIFGILILIYILTALVGGGGLPHLGFRNSIGWHGFGFIVQRS